MLLVGTAFTKLLFLPFGFKFGSLVTLYADTLSWYDLVGAVALYTFVIGFFGFFTLQRYYLDLEFFRNFSLEKLTFSFLN